MSCLPATFTLTPRSPTYNWGSSHNHAELYCSGADFWPTINLSSAYTSDRLFFGAAAAADPTLDYSQWALRDKARHLRISMDLGDYGARKQLALIFGFDVLHSWFGSNVDGRVQVYSDAGLLEDQQLVYGDNQFMLQLESVDQPLNLYFVHAGGSWFFKGLSGYVV